jgi:hypothetical protein
MFSEEPAASKIEVCPETSVHVYRILRRPIEEDSSLLKINSGLNPVSRIRQPEILPLKSAIDISSLVRL